MVLSMNREMREDCNNPAVVSNHYHSYSKMEPQPFYAPNRSLPGQTIQTKRRRKRTSNNSNWSSLGNLLDTNSSRMWQEIHRTHVQPMIRKMFSGSETPTLVLAVALWYSLGVISISTSKLLLSAPSASIDELGKPTYYAQVGGVAPMMLTVQQLLLGSTFLRFLLNMRFLQSPGVQPLAPLCYDSSSATLYGSSPTQQQENYKGEILTM